jgi:hypothetical protein
MILITALFFAHSLLLSGVRYADQCHTIDSGMRQNQETLQSDLSSLSAEVIWENTQHTRCVREVICVSLGE